MAVLTAEVGKRSCVVYIVNYFIYLNMIIFNVLRNKRGPLLSCYLGEKPGFTNYIFGLSHPSGYNKHSVHVTSFINYRNNLMKR